LISISVALRGKPLKSVLFLKPVSLLMHAARRVVGLAAFFPLICGSYWSPALLYPSVG